MHRNIPNAVMLLIYFCMIILATSCSEKEPAYCPVPLGEYENELGNLILLGRQNTAYVTGTRLWWTQNAQGQLYFRKPSGHDGSAFNLNYECDSVLYYNGYDFILR